MAAAMPSGRASSTRRPERALIAEATEVLTREEGRAPEAGSAHGSRNRTAPDLLAEAGYRYLLDWCHDDQPTWFATRGNPILAIPYRRN